MCARTPPAGYKTAAPSKTRAALHLQKRERQLVDYVGSAHDDPLDTVIIVRFGLFYSLAGTKLMCDEEPVDYSLLKGLKGEIEYAVRANGRMPAKEWLDAQTRSVQEGFGVVFVRLVTFGYIDNVDLFSKFKGMDDVWEFRKGPNRLICIKDGSVWVLTNHYPKGHSTNNQTKAGQQAIKFFRSHCERKALIKKQEEERKRKEETS